MHYRNLLLPSRGVNLAVLLLPLIAPTAFAEKLNYQQQGEVTLYVTEAKSPEILSRITDVDFPKLQRIRDLSQSEESTALTTINTDTRACRESFSGVISSCNNHYAWLTDGKQILWAGKKMDNPDVASFRAFGRFAADKDSLWFDGKRTDTNHDFKLVDMATLTETDVEDLLKDKRNLYYEGRWIGHAEGFRVLGQKSWSSNDTREANPLRTRRGVDFIVHTAEHIFVNGKPIAADTRTFKIVRWLPGTLLIYRDKHGEHHYPIGNEEQDCSVIFDIQSRQVTWRRRPVSEYKNCQVETLTGVDPEHFYRVKASMASSPGWFWQVKASAAQDQQLTTIALDDPQLVIDKRINGGKHHGYFIAHDALWEVATFSRLTVMGKKLPYYGYIYAHDDRYVYAFEPGDQLFRYLLPAPGSVNPDDDATRKKMDAIEEQYDPINKQWQPAQRNQG
ncbi:hypothetical protein [Pseudocitrobacter corydidari]|uniref:DKNYY family protein n=1 Tax=Pseudocitrobacter corydidari TaxID=2891570 RepID=A0ABY3S960_9ENTR|nr:hypothetical protein [Pseudocitrobacter corydidari]UGS42649.1 hypothetical protein G163CM_33980 [Pseudocitrobacter corydidari]